MIVVVALAAHLVARWPGSGPATLMVTAAGEFCVPGQVSELVAIEPASSVTRRSVRLVNRARGLDLVVLADQLEPHDWARLAGALRRLGGPGTRRF